MKIAFYSCEQIGRQFMAGYQIARLGAHLAVSQGDTPYVNKSGTWYGQTVAAHVVASSVADVFAHHELTQLTPGHRHLHANVARNWYMLDDHEAGGNNWAHTVATANDQTPVGVSDQAEVDAAFWVAVQAYRQQAAAYFDNPDNTDPGVEAEKPSNAAAGTPASQYPVNYFRQRFNLNGEPDAAGAVECFVLDCITHRSPFRALVGGEPDGEDDGLTLLGSIQLAWFKARLAASTATWKIIFSTKATHWPGTGGNADSWAFYTAERDEILAHIAANSITGVLWCAGDKHYPHVLETETHACVVACPVSVDTNTALVPGNVEALTWAADDQVFGWLDIGAERLDVSIRQAITGAPRFSAYMTPDANTLKYERVAVAA